MIARLRGHAVQALSWAMLTTVVAAALALIVVPRLNDAKPLTVLSGSMTGTYDIGDVVIVRPVETADLRAGDVITFQAISDDPALTTHRIQAVSYGSEGTQFITKGDANDAIDPEPIGPDQVMGQVWYSVPSVGYASVWMAGDWAQLGIQVLAGMLLLYGAWLFGAGALERVRGRTSEGSVVLRLPDLPKAPRTRWRHDVGRSYRHAFAASGVLAAVAVFIVVGEAPARAATERPMLLVGSSADGPFLDQLPAPLFDEDGPLVPGDAVTRTFWVKNAGPDPARTTVAPLDRPAAGEFEAALSLVTKVGGTPPRSARHGPGGPDCRVATGRRLAPGAVQPVHVTVSVADLEDQRGMGELAAVDLLVTLTQSTGGTVEICGEQATDPDPDNESDTGTDAAADGGSAGTVEGRGAECSRDVVVTTTGTPTCVPTAVNAGTTEVFGGGARELGLEGVAIGLLGGCLLVLARRRRREERDAAVV